ncbi:MAG TPA: hypothetical protein VLG50_08120 [Candidatus Saccharimonadales bacterium]|nr:hypothetical protein [Candidatus Saccharimonadales bacterium]
MNSLIAYIKYKIYGFTNKKPIDENSNDDIYSIRFDHYLLSIMMNTEMQYMLILHNLMNDNELITIATRSSVYDRIDEIFNIIYIYHDI